MDEVRKEYIRSEDEWIQKQIATYGNATGPSQTNLLKAFIAASDNLEEYFDNVKFAADESAKKVSDFSYEALKVMTVALIKDGKPGFRDAYFELQSTLNADPAYEVAFDIVQTCAHSMAKHLDIELRLRPDLAARRKQHRRIHYPGPENEEGTQL